MSIGTDSGVPTHTPFAHRWLLILIRAHHHGVRLVIDDELGDGGLWEPLHVVQ